MLSLELIKAETGVTDEKVLKELQVRIEELSMAVWQVFDKKRTYLSEQDSMVDTTKLSDQNLGRK
jgi:hypothetical protein